MKKYKNISDCFSETYGEFPYLIIREWIGVYRQIPISIGSQNENQPKLKYAVKSTGIASHDLQELIKDEQFIESLTNLALQAHLDYKKRSCLVLSPVRSLYFEDGRMVEDSKSIPAGGRLLDISGEIIGNDCIHYKIPIVYTPVK